MLYCLCTEFRLPAFLIPAVSADVSNSTRRHRPATRMSPAEDEFYKTKGRNPRAMNTYEKGKGPNFKELWARRLAVAPVRSYSTPWYASRTSCAARSHE